MGLFDVLKKKKSIGEIAEEKSMADKDLFFDFKTDARADANITNKFTDIVPDELLKVWRQYGFGSFYNGYLRIINPDDYMSLVMDTYFRGDVSVPILTTAFGDIINWEENRYARIVKYKNGTFKGMCAGFRFFFEDLLTDSDFRKDFFDIEKYEEALQILPKPKMDECYGYTPLLALGGSDSVDNLRIVKMKEHIYLISQLAGRIGD